MQIQLKRVPSEVAIEIEYVSLEESIVTLYRIDVKLKIVGLFNFSFFK